MKKNKLKYSSLFLPNQPLLRKYFKSNNFEDHLYYFIEKNSNVIRPRKKYKIYNPSKFSIEEMASNPISLSFLNFITNMIKPKYILRNWFIYRTLNNGTIKKYKKKWESNCYRKV